MRKIVSLIGVLGMIMLEGCFEPKYAYNFFWGAGDLALDSFDLSFGIESCSEPLRNVELNVILSEGLLLKEGNLHWSGNIPPKTKQKCVYILVNKPAEDAIITIKLNFDYKEKHIEHIFKCGTHSFFHDPKPELVYEKDIMKN